MQEIEINDKFQYALDKINEGADIFVTGKAGTGKSTFLEYAQGEITKRFAVLAPTGVAAVNVGGQTIHSFFGFSIEITPAIARNMRYADFPEKQALFRNVKTIIVDEVSMVRADIIDCMDAVLRTFQDSEKPFGGVQMIFIGDLLQLPPIVDREEKGEFEMRYQTPYFFSASVFGEFGFDYEFVEFDKVYRQADQKFISILNAIRTGEVRQPHLEMLNKRCQPFNSNSNSVYLASTKKIVKNINEKRLDRLDTPLVKYQASLLGKFNKSSQPAPEMLEIKEGAQVMLLNNDKKKRWVNGTIGKVVHAGGNYITVETEDDEQFDVEPFTWKIYEYRVGDDNKMEKEQVGEYSQIPLMLAWAITIHKSQGKTFNNVMVDMGNGAFANGQTYVALSRCKTLEGTILKRSIRKEDIMADGKLLQFLYGRS